MAKRWRDEEENAPGWGKPVLQYAACVMLTVGTGFATGWIAGESAEPSVVWPTKALEALPLRTPAKVSNDAAPVPQLPVPRGVPEGTPPLRAGAISVEGVLGPPTRGARAAEPLHKATGTESKKP